MTKILIGAKGGILMEQMILPNKAVEKMHKDFLAKRCLILNEEIAEDLVEKAILPILVWNQEDEGIDEDKRKPITIYINSPGGSVSDGFVLCNVIETSITPVHIITLGMAASMGGYIAMSGKKGNRKCYPFSTFLIHSGSMMVGGNSDAVESTVKYYMDTKKDIAEFVYRHTNISQADYKEHQKDEWYFNAEMAKTLGVVDLIIGIDC